MPGFRKILVHSLVTSIAVALVAWRAEAKNPPGPTALLSPDERVPSIKKGDRRVGTETGAPLALFNVGYEVGSGTPEEMARQYLRENHRTLHLRHVSLADLEHHATRIGAATTTVRFRQYFDGVPVYGAEVAVTLDRRNVVVLVMSSYKQVTLADTTPAHAAGTARKAALDVLGVKGDLFADETDLVVYHHRGRSRLAHRVRIRPRHSAGAWEVLRDAVTGEIFRIADLLHYVDGDGAVFDPDPLSSSGAGYGDTGFTDGGDADTLQMSAELANRTLPDIDETGGIHTLKGPYAEIVDHEPPHKGLFSQAASSFLFDRSDDGFEAVNAYYHLDSFMRYVNDTLGLDIMPFHYSGGVQFDPHGENGDDASHYDPVTGRLAFGEGGVDDAEDADVLIHELGHGLHDWVTAGGLSQVEGLSEGVGDYLAQSYSRSFGQWSPADPEFHHVFNWDGHNEFWAGRITDYPASYPGGLAGNIHLDGQIWSTCNMQIWDAIGREMTDKAMLEGLGMTHGATHQEDAAQAVLQAAVSLGYSSGAVSTMASIYQGCGYQVTTPPADLSLNLIAVPAGTYLPGDPILIHNVVENVGGEISPDYRITMFASTNDFITIVDTPLGFIDRGELAPGAVHNFISGGSLPADLPDGTYFIGAILTVSDADSSNDTNFDAAPITVETPIFADDFESGNTSSWSVP